MSIIELAIGLLTEFFTENKVSEDHGWFHCVTVLKNARRAIDAHEAVTLLTGGFPEEAAAPATPAEEKVENVRSAPSPADEKLTPDIILSIELAALLHEAGDKKLFPRVLPGQNETLLLGRLGKLLPTEWGRNLLIRITPLILEMISVVSASVSGNSVVRPRWKLIPRDADRVEALGKIGVKRCYDYTKKIGRPLILKSTPCPQLREEIEALITPERLADYVGGRASVDMLSHYFEKLFHLHHLQSENPYLLQLAKERREVMITFVLKLCRWCRENDVFAATDVLRDLPYELKFEYGLLSEEEANTK